MGFAGEKAGEALYDLIVNNARLYPMAADPELAAATSFAVEAGRITAFDVSGEAERLYDAAGRMVLPGFIDCHTHALFAGDRLAEHALKLEGASYEAIARAGGGIAATVQAVQAASEEELIAQSLPRLRALVREGVTCVEVKSGYGLATREELKMLRAIGRLPAELGIRIVATFLGAHTVPPGRDKGSYLDEVIEEMLPAVADGHLAEAVDIFVERIAFDVNDLKRLFTRARRAGLKLRAHTEQLSNCGGTRAACALGALSCDHLEHVEETDVRALAEQGTVAVLLPGAFYFLRETHKPPVDLLRRHGVPMAVATDLNPGSSPVASLLTVMHMAATLFGLTPGEVLLGVTRHAARALGLEQERGSLEVGKRADFSVWNLPAPEFLTYQLGGLQPDAVFVGGEPL